MSIDGSRTTESSASTHLADHVALHAQHNAIDAVVDGKMLVKTAGSVTGVDIPESFDVSGFLTADDLSPVVYTTTITGDGTTTEWPIEHLLGSGDVVVRVRSAASGTSFAEGADFDVEVVGIVIDDVDNITLTPSVTVPSGHVWRVTVVAWDLLNGLIGGTLSGGGGSEVDQTDIDTSIATHNSAVASHPLASSTVTIASGVVTINAATTKIAVVSLTENVTTITVSNLATVDQLRLVLTYSGGVRTITWPAWRWVGGVAPSGPTSTQTLIVDLFQVGGVVYASAAPYALVA